jgi:DNA-binding NarL/FixJ family response regulator
MAGDDVLFREGLASLLVGRGFAVVGQAVRAAQLLPIVRETAPDLVIISIMESSDHALEYKQAGTIRTEFPNTGVLVLCAHLEVQHAIDALSSGRGVSYLLNSRVTDIEDFFDVISRVAKGASIVGPAAAHELASAHGHGSPLAALSERELDVLRLMAEGRSNADIARRLCVAEGTVEKHVHGILSKLNIPKTTDVHRRVQAVTAYLSG